MSKYIDSFNKGINAAKDAERNRAEIDSVFAELNEQLAIATNNKAAIRRMQFDAPIDYLKAATALSAVFKREKYWTLAAVFLPSRSVESTEIAKWDQDNSGYPCRVTFGSNRYTCEDKAGLESVLETLLADALVGEVLHRYMKMELPAPKV